MLLTITTTQAPATDLGYLLHKNPARLQSFPLSFGQVHVFYPEATPERCTAALLLDVDPVALVRKDRGAGGEAFALQQYVNDRPYVASSFLSVAIAQVLGQALAGRSKERPDLAAGALPLAATLAVVPCRGGEAVLRRLFEPLGYAYVLVPVLDDEKHYWVGTEEVEKLLRHGAGWLAGHPARELIATRYLRHQRPLARAALARLIEEDTPDPDAAEAAHAQEEAVAEARISLHTQRLDAVVAVLKAVGAHRVLDLGCGEGRLLALLLKDPSFTAILGLDVATRALEGAAERLHLDRLPSHQQDRLRLVQGSLVYRDARLAGFDAAAVVEVIEHLDPPRLAAFERVLFEFARPATVALTTPNAEYNVRWPTLPAGHFRHQDHRFEWTRAEFAAWATGIAARFGYAVRFLPVGLDDAEVGPPTQLGVFTRADAPSDRGHQWN